MAKEDCVGKKYEEQNSHENMIHLIIWYVICLGANYKRVCRGGARKTLQPQLNQGTNTKLIKIILNATILSLNATISAPGICWKSLGS